ncbi:MAG: hypothetical protein VZR11_09375 [Succinimonas sp.]|jgi:hypothetical protein|nr:hypothetical protein [Succinimonas sp.]
MFYLLTFIPFIVVVAVIVILVRNTRRNLEASGQGPVSGEFFRQNDLETCNLYLGGIFQLAGYIGRSTRLENPYRNAIVQEYVRQLAPTPESMKLCENSFYAGFEKDFTPNKATELLNIYAQASGKNPDVRYIMTFLVNLSLCSGNLSPVEEKHLNEIGKLLKFSQRDLRKMIEECRRAESWKSFAKKDK